MTPRTPLWHYLIVLLTVNGLLFAALGLLHALALPGLLDAESFLFADANHYREIQATGYREGNVAFFPLAPFLWRWMDLGVYGILAFNGLIYGAAAILLARILQFSLTTMAFVCALPSMFFMFFPYSEAIFFLGGAVLLVGLHRDHYPLLLAGLLWCTLARPAFTVFFPALLITEFLRRAPDRLTLYRVLGFAGVMVLGVLVVGWIQWLDTGEWFRFFAVQRKWGNHLQLPQLPLDTWGGREALLPDAAALVVGVSAMVYVMVKLWQRGRGQKTVLSPAVVFSLCYLAGISLAVLIFRGGLLFSLNRFVFATPFAWVAMHFFLGSREGQMDWRRLGLAFLGLEAFFLLFRSYVHLENLLCFSGVALYFCALLATRMPAPPVRTAGLVLAWLIQFGYLVFAAFWMLSGHWIA